MSGCPDLARLDADRLWGAVLAAADGERSGLARAVAGLLDSDGSPRLGWVHPPGWRDVSRRLRQIRAARALPPAPRPGSAGAAALVLLGTGGWVFAAQALAETAARQRTRRRVVPLDSLDPAALRRGVAGRPAGYLAVSGSGRTLETRRLADAARCTEGRAARLVWLCDREAPPDAFALSARGDRDQIAMLGAPLSTAFLFPAAFVDLPGLARGYRGLQRRYRQLGAAAAGRATQVPADGPVRVRIVLPHWAGPGLYRWMLQLGRQVLCGKSDRFRPAVEVSGAAADPPEGEVRVDFSGCAPGLPALLRMLYAAGVFTACLGLRAGLPVAEHPNVDVYKGLIGRVPGGAAAPRTAVADLPALAAAWLASRPDLRHLHVVRYFSAGPGATAVPAERFTAATGRPCEVHEGSAWNHHSFHAVYADRSTAVLIVTGAPDTGSSDPPALVRAVHTLDDIARATDQALAGRSRLVHVATGEWGA